MRVTHNIDEIIDSLKKRNIPFTIYQTTLTKIVKMEKFDYFYTKQGQLKNIELAFINKVKRHVEKNFDLNTLKEITSQNVKFVDDYKFLKRNVFYSKEIFEIDLTSAFFYAAKKLEIINEEMFFQALNDKRISKKARLVALGNLAKRKIEVSFKNGKFEKPILHPPPPTAKCFFACASYVSDIMAGLKFNCGENFLFFWVDAIFFQTEKCKKEIELMLNEVDFPYKIKEIDRVIRKNEQIIVYDDYLGDKKRVFNFTKKIKRKIYE